MKTSQDDMTTQMQIHWKAPTTIALALAAGILLAIGHHLFYNILDGQPASSDGCNILGSQVSTQQLNIAGGTALSYLVNACLLAALATAYVQLFWRAMLHPSREVVLERLDTVFSALTTIHHILKVWVWWRYPLLFLLALLAWYVKVL